MDILIGIKERILMVKQFLKENFTKYNIVIKKMESEGISDIANIEIQKGVFGAKKRAGNRISPNFLPGI